MKFNADFKYGKKNGVSRACFRDNQRWMDAYSRVFYTKIAKPEVIRKKDYNPKNNASVKPKTTQMLANVPFYNISWILLI